MYNCTMSSAIFFRLTATTLGSQSALGYAADHPPAPEFSRCAAGVTPTYIGDSLKRTRVLPRGESNTVRVLRAVVVNCSPTALNQIDLCSCITPSVDMSRNRTERPRCAKK